MKNYRWNISPYDEERTAALKDAIGINRKLCGILVNRGISTRQAAYDYFNPALEHLHDPYLMMDMQKAVERIHEAKIRSEKVLVYGDYDVDGTTAVASTYMFLLNLFPANNLDYYTPNRYREGYGVSKVGVDYAVSNGFSLIICLDCGIKSTELIAYAKEQGTDFIVCDHHQPDEQLPAAVAVLNPKRKDCPYPYKELCGCGIGFKLMQALAVFYRLDASSYLTHLDLVATAIGADIVPITGENRILAYHGLHKINNEPSEGIKALKKLAAQDGKMHITQLVFTIAPRINAAGRMDDARKAVNLFIQNESDTAIELAGILHDDNSQRKEADKRITEEALAILNRENCGSRSSTVVYGDGWIKGVVGIVASRLIDHYYRPTIVLAKSGDLYTGSARSVDGFDIYKAINECAHLLSNFGGHFAAAGLTLHASNLEAFIDRFEEVVGNSIQEHQLQPAINIDAEISLTDITPTFYKITERMEPFGPGNMRPVFLTKNVKDTGYSKLVKDAHIKFVVTDGFKTLSGIGFHMADHYSLVKSGHGFDMVYTLDEDEYKGEKTIRLKVLDIKPHDLNN